MKKLFFILFIFFVSKSFGQVYQEMPQYGYRANRMAFDSTLQIPTTCGVPTLKSVISVNKKSAIAFDSCNNKFYYYNPVSLTWILLTGGGTTIVGDTAKVVIAQVRNIESTTLQIGEVVFLKSSTGNIASVKRASNKDDSTSSRTLGVVRAAIAPNETGYVTTQGQCEKMNLGSYAEGDVLWLDSIAGGLTKSKPIAPFHGVFIGIVERANNGNGIAYIKPANGFELSEIHDVQIINPLNNQILVYSDTQKIWKNRKGFDTTSLSNRINLKFAIADTGNKWVNSVSKVNDTTIRVVKNTTTTDLIILGKVIDTTSFTGRINSKLAISDTANKWVNSVTKLNDSTIRVIKNTTTSDLLIRGNPQQAVGSNGLNGTSIIKLGGNLDNGVTEIESTSDANSSLSFGNTRKLDAFILKNNQTSITSANDIYLIQPTNGVDTTNYKPLGVSATGKIAKINKWFGGGSSSTDTTSLSNRINGKIDSLKRSNDSVYAYKNGVRYFQYKDSIGGGGTPTLQQVTDAGATTTNSIILDNGNQIIIDNTGIFGNTSILLLDNTNGYSSILEGNKLSLNDGQLQFTSHYNPDKIEFFNAFSSMNIIPRYGYNDTFPAQSGTLAMSVNNKKADSSGNITISTGADSSVFYTKYRSDTSRTNIYSSINGKQASGTYVTSVTGSLPISSSGGTTPQISIAQANTTTSGYITSTDYTNFSNNNILNGFGLMGSSFKGTTLTCPDNRLMASATLVDGSMRFVAVYIPAATILTGVKFYQANTSSYTADNYNGVGLFSVSGGTMTLVASSTNDGNIWKGTINTWQTKAFSSTYSASAGLYYVGALYNSSAEVTAPIIGGATALLNAAVSTFDFTNSNKIVGASAQSTMPSSVTLSGTTNTNLMYGLFIY